MATVTRYVNTASSAGGGGTTNATTGDNRAYASLSEWEAAEQTDLVTDGDIHVVHCEGSSVDSYAAGITIDGWTTGTSNYITIIVDSDRRHDGKWNTGKYRIECTGGSYGFQILEDYVRIEGIQVESTYRRTINYTGSGEFHLSHSIVRTDNTYSLGGIQINTSGTVKIWNNIIYGYGTNKGAYGLNIANCTAYVHANTVVDCFTAGITHLSATVYVSNNLVFNCTDDYNGSMSGNNNAYSEGTDPVSNGVDISGYAGTDIFVDYTNDDFHIKSGTTLENGGTDLDSHANCPVTDDIDGDTRHATTPDIGADEAVSGGTEYSVSASAGLSLSMSDTNIADLIAAVQAALNASESTAMTKDIPASATIGIGLSGSDIQNADLPGAAQVGITVSALPGNTADYVVTLPAGINLSADVLSVLDLPGTVKNNMKK